MLYSAPYWGKSGFAFWNLDVGFLNRTWNLKTDFMFSRKKIFLRQNSFFGYHILLGNPKSAFCNQNPDFPIENALGEHERSVGVALASWALSYHEAITVVYNTFL